MSYYPKKFPIIKAMKEKGAGYFFHKEEDSFHMQIGRQKK
jgi:hypothetical protein